MPRRPIVAAVALSLLLAACSGGGDGESSGRSVTHAMGTTRVADRPVRVVVLDAGELDAVVALGITPVGATRVEPGGPLPDYISDALGGTAETIADVGPLGAPDLSAIAALDPDLVLSSRARHGALYPELAKIAPTVFSETTGPSWKQDFLLAADALGRRTDADRLLADYEARARSTAAAYAGVVAGAALFVPEVRLYGADSFVGTVLTDAGVATGVPGEFREALIGQAQTPALFYAGYLATGQRALEDTTRTAGWRALPAVRGLRAVEVPDEIWFLACGPVGAQLVLDDLQRLAPRLARTPRSSAPPR